MTEIQKDRSLSIIGRLRQRYRSLEVNQTFTAGMSILLALALFFIVIYFF